MIIIDSCGIVYSSGNVNILKRTNAGNRGFVFFVNKKILYSEITFMQEV